MDGPCVFLPGVGGQTLRPSKTHLIKIYENIARFVRGFGHQTSYETVPAIVNLLARNGPGHNQRETMRLDPENFWLQNLTHEWSG